MADIIKFVRPEPKAEPAPKGLMTDEEFIQRMARITKTTEGALEAIAESLESTPWTAAHARDLAILSHELGNLFEVAANLMAARDAQKPS